VSKGGLASVGETRSGSKRRPDHREGVDLSVALDIGQAFYDGIKHKPDTTFGNVKADVIADKEPDFRRGNFCGVIRASCWPGGTHAPGCGCGQHD